MYARRHCAMCTRRHLVLVMEGLGLGRVQATRCHPSVFTDVRQMSSDQVLCETNKTAQRGIIKWHSLGLRQMPRGHALSPITVDVVGPTLVILESREGSAGVTL